MAKGSVLWVEGVKWVYSVVEHAARENYPELIENMLQTMRTEVRPADFVEGAQHAIEQLQ